MKNNLRYDPMDQNAEGVIWCALSGAMTGIAAAADVGGVVNLLDAPWVIQRIRIRWVTSTAFATAQCLAFRVNKVTGFTAVHTGGTPTAVQAHHLYGEGIGKTRAGVTMVTGDRIPLTEISGVISSTAALTTPVYTAEDTDEPEVFAMGAGSTLPSVYENWAPPGPPLVLTKNTGLIINNHILMGASGVGNLFVGVDGYRLG
jgi:hypothetical protein